MVPGKYGLGTLEPALRSRFCSWNGPASRTRWRKALLGLKTRGMAGVHTDTGRIMLGIKGMAILEDFQKAQKLTKPGSRGSITGHLVDRAMKLSGRLS